MSLEQKILFVDDEPHILEAYESVLQMAGYTNLIPCQESHLVLGLVERERPDVILLDLTMPKPSGEELLSQITTQYPEIPVMIITGNDDISTAVSCIKMGALDFLTKPITKERLLVSVQAGLKSSSLNQENTRLRESLVERKLQRPELFSAMVTNNEEMLSIFQYIEAVAVSPMPVLVVGETGVGKELMARAVHDASGRDGEFVAVNVAGLDDNVFADTLFGHAKGAFTGADTVRKGMVETAAGGTLFLDEIGDMTPGSQVKLLRLLQENEYLPLGMDKHKRSTARIVAATNREFSDLQESSDFRMDLFYRLRSHAVRIPPLRERLDDLPILLNHFFEKAAETLGKEKPAVPAQVLNLLFSHSFPGNLRELETMVFNAVSAAGQGPITVESFKKLLGSSGKSGNVKHPPGENGGGEGVVFGNRLPTMNEMKGMLIDEALRRCDDNKSQAADLLGMTRQALNWRIKKNI